MHSALDILLPKIVPGVGTAIRSFDGKPDLLKRLPGLLRGYAHWPDQAGLGVVVVIDRDNDDCRRLLSELDGRATAAGFEVVSVTAGRGGTLANRLAAEELEAWWFGDLAAVRAAYPGVRARGQAFREPDSIRGGTWEAFERALQHAGHHPGGLRKVAAAEDIAPHLDIEANRSPSFVKFRDGVRLLVNGPC